MQGWKISLEQKGTALGPGTEGDLLCVYYRTQERSSVLAGGAAGLVWFPGPREVRMEGKGGNAISRKAMEGSSPVTACGGHMTRFCFKYQMG